MSINNKFSNHFGINFPTENASQMTEALAIQAEDKVLDVGGGGAPFERANIIVDYDLSKGLHRDKNAPPIDERWIVADIHALPFADKSFDFVYCTHVLEHVSDPKKACQELMRVAARGYIETPEKFTELVHGHPTHRWLIERIDNKIIFEPRYFIQSPLQNFALAHVLNYSRSLDRYLTQYRNISCIQLMWDGSFDYEVKSIKEGESHFNYEDNEQAAWSHYYFALNLMANHAPVYYTLPHIETACSLRDNIGIFYALLACAHIISGDLSRAKNLFPQAEKLAPDNECIEVNMQRLASGNILSVMLPENRGEYVLDQSKNIKILEQKNCDLTSHIEELKKSTSWKITKPIRYLKTLVNKLI